MRRESLRRTILVLILGVAPISLSGQLVVDASHAMRDRLRSPAAGTVGSVGRRLPVDVTIGAESLKKGVVEIEITNTGRTELVLPVSPDAGELEPADPHEPYTLQVLNISLTSSEGARQVAVGEASLYSSAAAPSTYVRLAPEESVRVLIASRLSKSEAASTDASPNARVLGVVVAHATLSRQAITVRDGKLYENTEELGYADSAPVSLGVRSD